MPREKPLLEIDGPDDPEACETCRRMSLKVHKVVEGSTSCVRHGGNLILNNLERQKSVQYQVQVWNRRLREFAGSHDIKSLRDEISILRILMEETVRKCKNANDLLMFSSRIQAIANDIQRLVTACDKLERNMGEMMDRQTAISFAIKIVEIIGSEITDSDVLDRISHKIVEEVR